MDGSRFGLQLLTGGLAKWQQALPLQLLDI
jgi:hypothetical protein